MKLIDRLTRTPRELKLFALASLMMGMAYSIYDATFNNFLDFRFELTGFQRSFLEFPRELPGFLVVFVSALLWFLCSRRLSVVSLLLSAVGTLLIGFASSSYGVMVLFLFLYSMGQHLIMPLASTIGMELARDGQTGRRLGQLNAIRNLAAVLGSFLVFLGFTFLGFTFQHTFVLIAIGLVLAAGLMFSMRRQEIRRPKTFLALHKEYKLFYWLNVLYGSRKQIFITFAPWVIVTVLEQPTQVIATLLTIGGVIGILFQPLLGRAIDRLGERAILASEAVLLVFVCLGYGFAKFIFPEDTARIIMYICFLVDQMLFSVSMARAMYIKKIAKQDADVQAALTAGVTIDHFFSISVALLGGLIWSAFGFQYVFLLGILIAGVNFFVALQVRIPPPGAAGEAGPRLRPQD
ncbi:MAG: MFS transporter [Anaerolineales bacterium]|nr:MFS transporter [Anaerolineales bacterium]